MKRRWIIPAAVGGLVLLGGFAVASTSTTMTVPGKGKWVDATASARIRELGDRIEAVLGWGGLSTYLVATAYLESKGNSSAVGDQQRSWGWFQIRKTAKCMIDLGLEGPELVGDEPLQIAVAACHARRLGIVYDSPGQLVQWGDIRRGWKYPKWVAEEYRTDPATLRNRTNFARSLRGTGASQSFAFAAAFPSGLDVPPVQQLVAIARGNA